MAQFIDDLLELSRVGQRQVDSGTVDTKALVEGTLEEL